MVETETPNGKGTNPPLKKACSISLMFEIESDDEALVVKKVIDNVCSHLPHKRYSFQIMES